MGESEEKTAPNGAFVKDPGDFEARVENAVARRLIIIITLCAIFMTCEIVGGLMANSLAIMCDAFHLLSDLGGFVIGLMSTRLASRTPTRTMNFGHRRVEVLGAFSSVIFIWFLTVALLYFAIIRIVHSDFEINTRVMIAMASVGLFINAIMAISISYSGEPTSDAELKSIKIEPKKSSSFLPPRIVDSSSLKPAQSNEKLETTDSTEQLNRLVSRNINIRAAFIHIIGDLMQSLGVLIASLIIFFKPHLKIADPICTIVFSVIVLATTLPIMSDILNVLNNSFPKQLSYEGLIDALKSVQGVKSARDLKAWYISTGSFAIDVKVVLDSSCYRKNQINTDLLKGVVNNCRKRLKLENVNFEHVNIEVELEEEVLRDSSSKESIFVPSFLTN
jgi:zinc transporter 2